MFSVHTTAEKFENATITGQFGLVVVETLGREITILERFSFDRRKVIGFAITIPHDWRKKIRATFSSNQK